MAPNPSLAAAVGPSYPLSGSPMPPQGPQATQGSPAPPPPAQTTQPPPTQPVPANAAEVESGEKIVKNWNVVHLILINSGNTRGQSFVILINF